MSASIKASGYIVYNDSAIWSVGVSPHDAWVNTIKFLNEQPDEETIQKYIDDGFSVEEATQELIDTVNELGGAISWDEVDGIHCTKEQKQEYEESLLKALT